MASPRWPSPNNHPVWASPRHTLHPESSFYRLPLSPSFPLFPHLSFFLFLFPPSGFIIFVNSIVCPSPAHCHILSSLPESIGFQHVCSCLLCGDVLVRRHLLFKKNGNPMCLSTSALIPLFSLLSRGLTHLFVLPVLWDVCLFPSSFILRFMSFHSAVLAAVGCHFAKPLFASQTYQFFSQRLKDFWKEACLTWHAWHRSVRTMAERKAFFIFTIQMCKKEYNAHGQSETYYIYIYLYEKQVFVLCVCF